MKKLIRLLPEFILHRLYRRRVNHYFKIPENVVVKLAETKNEMDQAFQILHDSYVNDGLMVPNEVHQRITKYHLLSTSVMVIVKRGDEVLGTATHILDSPLGLPSEDLVDIQFLRKQGGGIAEISALAIKKEYRHTALLFALTRYLYYLGAEISGVRFWLISVRKRMAPLYKGVFFFRNLDMKQIKYGFVNYVTASTLYCDLRELPALFEKHYMRKKSKDNLFDFYVHCSKKEIGILPEPKFFEVEFSNLSPSLLNHYFHRQLDVLKDLTSKEIHHLHNSYFYKEFFDLFPEPKEKVKYSRKHPRFAVNCDAHIRTFESLWSYPIIIKEVSCSGLRVEAEELPLGSTFQITISIGVDELIRLSAKIATQNPPHHGFRLIGDIPEKWIEKVQSLDQRKNLLFDSENTKWKKGS